MYRSGSFLELTCQKCKAHRIYLAATSCLSKHQAEQEGWTYDRLHEGERVPLCQLCQPPEDCLALHHDD
jgi:hypothetical protein